MGLSGYRCFCGSWLRVGLGLCFSSHGLCGMRPFCVCMWVSAACGAVIRLRCMWVWEWAFIAMHGLCVYCFVCVCTLLRSCTRTMHLLNSPLLALLSKRAHASLRVPCAHHMIIGFLTLCRIWQNTPRPQRNKAPHPCASMAKLSPALGFWHPSADAPRARLVAAQVGAPARGGV